MAARSRHHCLAASKRLTPRDVSDRVPLDPVPCCNSALRSAGHGHSNILVCDVLRYQPHNFDIVTINYKCYVISFWCANRTHCDMHNNHPDNRNMKTCSHCCKVRSFFLNYRTGHLCCIKRTCEKMSEKSLARSVSLRFCKRKVTLKSSEIKIIFF